MYNGSDLVVFGASLRPSVLPDWGVGSDSQLLQSVFTVPVVLGFGKPSKYRENVSLVPVQSEGTRGSLHLLLLGHNCPLSAELGASRRWEAAQKAQSWEWVSRTACIAELVGPTVVDRCRGHKAGS